MLSVMPLANKNYPRSQARKAEATIKIYINSSVGIGEHPQHLEEIDKLITKIAEAKDKLEAIEPLINK